MNPKALLCFFPLVLCAIAPAQDAPSVDDLIARNSAARGGADKLKAVRTLKITGKMVAVNGMELPMSISIKRPGMMRMEMNVQGKGIVQAFDGETAWSVNPLMGTEEPKMFTAEESRDFRDNAESFLDGPMADYKSKGNKVEYAGKEDVEGSPAYKLKITTKRGSVIYDYVDAKTYLEVRTTAKTNQMGQEMEVDTYARDYKPEGGVMMAHLMDSKVNGASMMKMSLDKVEVNSPLDDALFKLPAKAEPKKQ